MKQAATEKKTNSVKAKKQDKTSANVVKKAKMPEKSVAARKSAAPVKTVSAKSVKLPEKSPVKAGVSKNPAPEKQGAKSLNSVTKPKATKPVLSKIAKNKTAKTRNTKAFVPENAVSVKNLKTRKSEANLTAQKAKPIKSKVLPAAPELPKAGKNKRIEPKVQKVETKARKREKAAAKPEIQPAKQVKAVNEKSKAAKPKTAEITPRIAEKSVSKPGKPGVSKPFSAGKNSPVPAKKENPLPKVSTPKIKKAAEKALIKPIKTKAAAAGKPLETMKPEPAKRKTKTALPKAQTAPGKPAVKTVSKAVKPEVKTKTVKKAVQPKVPAKSEPNGILKYAKPAITGKTKAPQRAAAKIEIVIQPKIEPKTSEEIKETKKKPLRAISSAVFRGEKDSYSFKVYEIGENFKEIPAVYVISKRITDRRNRGHHKLICIGETDSLLKDLKTHRKSKCLRTNKANVISILREDDKETRLKIENDLKAAHSIACNLER